MRKSIYHVSLRWWHHNCRQRYLRRGRIVGDCSAADEDDGSKSDYDVYLDPGATQSQALEAEEFDSKAPPKATLSQSSAPFTLSQNSHMIWYLNY